MNLEFKLSEGSQEQKPSEIDTISSKSVVYIRRNIRQKESKDDETGVLWQYEEAQTDKDRAIQYLANLLQNAQEAIDFILMGGV